MRLGILGGSFNPIHLGHLVIAGAALRQLRLDRVLFVPSFQPPHKCRQLASFAHRLQMVRLAIAAEPRFICSDLESRLAPPSYTIDTLRVLRTEYPAARRYFLLGSDQYQAMASWHEPARLTMFAQLVVMERPGFTSPALFPGHNPRRVKFLAVPAILLSSALIRARLAKGSSVRYTLPTPVLSYIRQHRLYSS